MLKELVQVCSLYDFFSLKVMRSMNHCLVNEVNEPLPSTWFIQ